MGDDKRDSVNVNVRMTKAERERIRDAAEKIGVGLSTYLRMAAIKAAGKDE